MAKAKQEKIAAVSVLSFEKRLVPSAAYLYGTAWDNRNSKTPLAIHEKSVRGTISNRQKPAIKNDPVKLNAEVEKANLQVVDECTLGVNQDTLRHVFTLKVLGGIHEPSACNDAQFSHSYKAAVKGYIDREGFRELARRYAINIASGRSLWRNRVGAPQIEVQVKTLNQDEDKSWTFDGTNYSIRNFDADDSTVNDLADSIAKVLSSESDSLILEVTTDVLMANGQEVYPSQELVLDKSSKDKSNKSKILYQTEGIAAMHSQKVGNALRSIDTWYPSFDDPENTAGPIAIEPYGAVTNKGKAYRTPVDKQDFYSLFDKWARGNGLDSIEQEHYVLAVLVRGGVFSESEKQ